MKVMVVYESKYGNTKRAAETIIEGMKESGKVEVFFCKVKEVDFNKIADYDIILIGSPNHIGGPTRSVRKFVDGLAKLKLKEKQIAVFDTYLGEDFERAVKKMEKRIREKLPELKLISPGLSIRVEGMKGPILSEELSRCKDFGRKIVTPLE